MDTDRPVRILIVDEEQTITHILRLGLELEGWSVAVAHSGTDAIPAALDADIVLLDMMLPDMLGTRVVTELRRRGGTAHVVFLTGRDDLDDRSAAYAAGADDYITKPFGVEEVVDRIHQTTQRLGLAATSLRVGDLILDTELGMAWRGDELLPLTPLAIELLRQLMERPGMPATTGQLRVAATRRGIHLPYELTDPLLEQTREAIATTGSPLLRRTDEGWLIGVAEEAEAGAAL